MLNHELELSLNIAFAKPVITDTECQAVEHLLLALLSNKSAREALEACKVDLAVYARSLKSLFVKRHLFYPSMSIETQPTLSFQRVLQRAVFHVQSSGKNEVSGANIAEWRFLVSKSLTPLIYYVNMMLAVLMWLILYSHGILKDDQQNSDDQSDMGDINAQSQQERCHKAMIAWIILPLT